MDDLARTFFDFLYDQRVPIAIATGLLFAAMGMVAWRRGWLAAARRHPARSAVVVALAVAVGAPLSWYLASPIWVRTALVEAGPSAPALRPVASLPVVPSARASASGAQPTTAPTIVAPTPFAPATVVVGEFAGTDEFHFGRGTASVIEVEPGRYHLRLDDFSVRNGPDLYVYLSTAADDYADGALELGKLKATDGAFGYEVPEGTDIGRFRSAIIWCKQFSHLFAVAPF